MKLNSQSRVALSIHARHISFGLLQIQSLIFLMFEDLIRPILLKT